MTVDHINNPSSNFGFSLIELMVTLAIAAIFLTVAAPSLNQIYQSQKAQSRSAKLHTMLQYSRTLAVTSNTYVTLCPSKNQKKCSNNWQEPIMIFLDSNKNEKVEDETHIRKVITIIDNKSEILTLRAAAGRQYIQFNRHGFVNSTNGKLNYCLQGENNERYNRSLVISLAGRIRVETPDQAVRPIKCSNT